MDLDESFIADQLNSPQNYDPVSEQEAYLTIGPGLKPEQVMKIDQLRNNKFGDKKIIKRKYSEGFRDYNDENF